MKLLLLASAGGAIGSGLRFLVNQAMHPSGQFDRGVLVFPWATLTVNVVGGLLMGIVAVVVAERLGNSPEWRVFLATGILGGLTTFSAFSLDTMNLAIHDGPGSLRLLAYVIGSVAVSFLALAAGMALARWVLA